MMNLSFWCGKKVFITGHTGFKGSWLSMWLNNLGAIVTGYALEPQTTPSLFSIAKIDARVSSVIGDVRSYVDLEKALISARPEIVFHLAAQALVRKSYNEPQLTYDTNIMGTVNLLEAIKKCNSVRSVVIITSDKCYENKEWFWGYRENDQLGGYDPYSSSKACVEIIAKAYQNSFFNKNDYINKYQIAMATARAGNVIGGGDWAEDRLIPDIIKSIINKSEVIIRNPESIRPWQFVLEPLGGYLLLAEKLFTNGIEYSEAWNFGPYDNDTKNVRWIVNKLQALWPSSLGYSDDKSSRLHEATYLKLDCSKAYNRLNWIPTWTLDKALTKIVEWNHSLLNGYDMYNISIKQIEEFVKDWEHKR